MTTSHVIGGNVASDVPKDLKADADEKIVIDKLLVNKLTELLIISIYSVHVSRRSEIFLALHNGAMKSGEKRCSVQNVARLISVKTRVVINM